MENNYCRRCGLRLKEEFNGFVCGSGHTIYTNPIPTVSLFLLNPAKTHVTLAVRAIDPGKGLLDAIGGFLETGETAEQGVLREAAEEAGLQPHQINSLHFISTDITTYHQAGEARPVLSIAFWASLPETTELRPGDDIADYKTFLIASIPIDEIAGDDNRQAVQKLQQQLGLRPTE